MGRVVLKALTAVGGLAIIATAVAVAATAPRGDGGDRAGHPSQRLPVPRITVHPDPVESATTASFRFAARDAKRFQCSIDGGRWRVCRAPVTYGEIGTGGHVFAVRVAVAKPKRHGRSRRFRWVRAESRPFSIVALGDGPPTLYPGAAPSQLPLRIENPNTIPIFVTAITVSVAADPPGCDSATNLELSASSASDLSPLLVPAQGSAQVPAAGVSAPAIALRDLPVNQDACQNVSFPLSYSGRAHG